MTARLAAAILGSHKRGLSRVTLSRSVHARSPRGGEGERSSRRQAVIVTSTGQRRCGEAWRFVAAPVRGVDDRETRSQAPRPGASGPDRRVEHDCAAPGPRPARGCRAGVGVDGIIKEQYGQELEARLQHLHERLATGRALRDVARGRCSRCGVRLAADPDLPASAERAGPHRSCWVPVVVAALRSRRGIEGLRVAYNPLRFDPKVSRWREWAAFCQLRVESTGIIIFDLMKIQCRAAMVVFLGALVAIGCGGTRGLDAQETCEQLSAALCHLDYACLTPAQLEAGAYPATEAQCVSNEQDASMCSSRTAENACGGNLKYQPDRAADCVDLIAGLTCDRFGNVLVLLKNSPECDGVCVSP